MPTRSLPPDSSSSAKGSRRSSNNSRKRGRHSGVSYPSASRGASEYIPSITEVPVPYPSLMTSMLYPQSGETPSTSAFSTPGESWPESYAGTTCASFSTTLGAIWPYPADLTSSSHDTGMTAMMGMEHWPSWNSSLSFGSSNRAYYSHQPSASLRNLTSGHSAEQGDEPHALMIKTESSSDWLQNDISRVPYLEDSLYGSGVGSGSLLPPTTRVTRQSMPEYAVSERTQLGASITLPSRIKPPPLDSSESFVTAPEVASGDHATQRRPTGEADFVCDVCGKRYRKRHDLKEHRQKHVPNRERPFRCEVHQLGFDRGADLRRHLDTVHNPEKKYTCDRCQRSLSRSDTLLRHKQSGCYYRDQILQTVSGPPPSHISGPVRIAPAPPPVGATTDTSRTNTTAINTYPISKRKRNSNSS